MKLGGTEADRLSAHSMGLKGLLWYPLSYEYMATVPISLLPGLSPR